MAIETRRLNSTRQQGNQGKLGFVPTSRKVIEMEMKLIDFSELEGTDIVLNICDLSGGVGDQLDEMQSCLDSLNIQSNAYYNELNLDRFNEGCSKYPYFNSLNADIFFTKIGAKKGKEAVEKRVFSIIHNNPPYGYDKDKWGETVRLEKRFFEKNCVHDIMGGIHLLELPIGVIDKELLALITYRYKVAIVKFPRDEYEAHKQVCLIMQKKKEFSREKEIMENILANIEADNIPYIEDIETPIFKVTLADFSKTPEVYYFRKNEITDETLFIGGSSVWGELVQDDYKKSKARDILVEQPIIELLQGHVASLLASGRYNGIMGNLLVTGGSNKVIEVTVSEDEKGNEITTETEVLKPFIELTNKNGDIIFKDF